MKKTSPKTTHRRATAKSAKAKPAKRSTHKPASKRVGNVDAAHNTAVNSQITDS